MLSLPTVSVPEPSATSALPERLATARFTPFRSTDAPAATLKPPDPSDPAPLSRSVPALTVVRPEYVLAAESVSVPVPVFVSAPVPLITAVTVALLPLVSMMPPPAPSDIGVENERFVPLASSVPPVNVAVVPVVASEPEVVAMKVEPAASSASPLDARASMAGLSPLAMVPLAVSAPVPALIVNIVTVSLLLELLAYRNAPSALIAMPDVT